MKNLHSMLKFFCILINNFLGNWWRTFLTIIYFSWFLLLFLLIVFEAAAFIANGWADACNQIKAATNNNQDLQRVTHLIVLWCRRILISCCSTFWLESLDVDNIRICLNLFSKCSIDTNFHTTFFLSFQIKFISYLAII